MIWNVDFTKTVPVGAAGNQAQFGIFFDDDKGIIQRLTEAEGHEVNYTPESVDRNPIGQEAPTAEIRSYNLVIDKDIIIKKGAPNYEFFAQMKRLRPTGDNAKLPVYLVDFRMEETGGKHNKYYTEKMDMTITINSVNETEGILSVNFTQDGDFVTGIMKRTDSGDSEDESTYTYGFTPSRWIPPATIAASADKVEVAVGETARAAVSFSPLGCPFDFTVESGDKTKAVVSKWNQSVDIKGRAVGETTVTVTSTFDPEVKKVINVRVGMPPATPVTGVSLNKDTLELEAGETERLVATVAPAGATNKNVTWGSGNTDIATVDQSGNVLAIATGMVTITVTTADGGFEAQCEVTVTV